jgi:hypothetical protein
MSKSGRDESPVPALVFTYIPTIPIRFAQGIISNILWLLDSSTNSSNPTSFHFGDNSTYKLQFTTFLKFESHYFAMLVFRESHYD